MHLADVFAFYFPFTAQKTANSTSLNFGRIAKPLRGGGGVGAAGGPATLSGGAPSSNPLARIQDDSSASCACIAAEILSFC